MAGSNSGREVIEKRRNEGNEIMLIPPRNIQALACCAGACLQSFCTWGNFNRRKLGNIQPALTGAGGESDGSVVCATGTVGIPGRTSGAEPASILARGQPLGIGESHGWSRGARSWVPVQTQAERECEEADRTNLPERGMGGGGATMAGERGGVAVERMEQGAAGGGGVAAVAEQTGSGSRNGGPEEVPTKSDQTVDLGSTGTDLPGNAI